MASLSIPEAIKENGNLSSDAKIIFSQLFDKLKKGERPTIILSDVAFEIAATLPQLHDGVRNLAEEGYAFLDESVDTLEDLIPGQMVRMSPRVHIEVLPYLPTDDYSVDKRRYKGENDVFHDVFKVGRMLFKATVSSFMGEFSISVSRLDFPFGAKDIRDAEEHAVAQHGPFKTVRHAWDWFDKEFCADPPVGPMGFDVDKPGEKEIDDWSGTVTLDQDGMYRLEIVEQGTGETVTLRPYVTPRDAWAMFDKHVGGGR